MTLGLPAGMTGLDLSQSASCNAHLLCYHSSVSSGVSKWYECLSRHACPLFIQDPLLRVTAACSFEHGIITALTVKHVFVVHLFWSSLDLHFGTGHGCMQGSSALCAHPAERAWRA